MAVPRPQGSGVGMNEAGVKRPWWRHRGFVWLLLWLLGASGVAAGGDVRVLTFGVVPQFEQRQLAANWRPVLADLSRRTGVRFELVGTPDIPRFDRQLMAGRFDCAYMNPYQYVRAHRGAAYVALARDHGRRLRGIVVVPRNSTIRNPRHLAGRVLAFPSPRALGATLLVRHELRDRYGVEVVPRYVATHDSVYLNVATGLVDAGGGVRRTFDEQPAAVKRALRIVFRTRGVVPHPIACHRRLGTALLNRIQAALLAMGSETSGAALLAKIPIRHIGPAEASDYSGLDGFRVPREQGGE